MRANQRETPFADTSCSEVGGDSIVRRVVRGVGLWLTRIDQPGPRPGGLPDYTTNTGGGGTIWIPAKYGLLLVVPPAVLLWWLDRPRIPPGHCQKCGYDLTGNVSGKCPECGAAIASEADARDANG